MPEKKIPKKRGRKPKKKNHNEPKPPPKKRGRKPKGGKIIKKNHKIIENTAVQNPNIILHLKCKSEQLNTLNTFNTSYSPNVSNPEAFNINSNNLFDINYEVVKNDKFKNNLIINNQENINNLNVSNLSNKTTASNDSTNSKKIWEKLNRLKYNLRTNNVSDKRSSCFWCTYPFDNPAIHIPKQYNDGVLDVYGCFCSPECALSYLKNEQLDESTKWERYSLLNNVYSKIYDYTKNIKPAPNPHYTLDKYYGNLTIQEYRKLLRKERIFMVVDKPMTKILPELYEENNEIPNVYNNILDVKNNDKSNNFRLKRSQIKQTKANVLSNTFNL
jgi:hypothetical protein